MTTIAVVGDRDLSHRTHRELDAVLGLLPRGVGARWVASDTPDLPTALTAFDALWFAPGTPHRDPDAIIAALTQARATRTPTLGTCGGFQMACIELARTELGLAATHQELEPHAPDAFVAELGFSLVGEWRTVTPVPGTRLADAMGTEPFDGFHWCRYGLPDPSVQALQHAGVTVSAHAPDAGVEAIELPGHPFFVATLFQPQVRPAPSGDLPPLLRALVAATGATSRPAGPVGRPGAVV